MRSLVGREILDGYRLRLFFRDGARRTLDFENMLVGPMFAPLRDLRKFREVRVNKDFGSLEWPNGADYCPDVLYQRSSTEGRSTATERAKYGSDVLGEPMAKRKCRTTYRVKVKSKKTGRWRWGFIGCDRKQMERAVRLYKEKFGETAKIVKA